jgi:hypothetical protein
MAQDNSGSENRSPYRDNDDVRDPLAADKRQDLTSDSKSEARGSARENFGNHSRGTAAAPTGAEDNDKTRNRPRDDEFDQDLRR